MSLKTSGAHPSDRLLDYLNEHYPHEGKDRFRLHDKAYTSIARHNNNCVILHKIYTTEHGKGYGRAALNLLCRLADQQQCSVLLIIVPFNPDVETVGKRMTMWELFRWYSRKGFVKDRRFSVNMYHRRPK